eukprot:749536-Hanusia_phi.AAC.4
MALTSALVLADSVGAQVDRRVSGAVDSCPSVADDEVVGELDRAGVHREHPDPVRVHERVPQRKHSRPVQRHHVGNFPVSDHVAEELHVGVALQHQTSSLGLGDCVPLEGSSRPVPHHHVPSMMPEEMGVEQLHAR